jgi:hypothetical protein
VPIREIVSQISPPVRILVAAGVVFLALWFTVLRPKSGETTPVAATPTPATGNVNTGAPAVSGVGKIVQKAKTAAAGASQAASAAAGEATATASATPAAGSAAATKTSGAPAAQSAPAIPARVLDSLPHRVSKALSAHKLLVLGVIADGAKPWRPMPDDDRYVRNTLSHVNTYAGDVVIQRVPLSTVATYHPLIGDLNVDQTPSIVIVDRDLKATVLTGYVDRISINQAIADARDRSTSPRITDSFLKQANQVCANGNVSFSRWSLPTIRGRKAWLASGRRLKQDEAEYISAVKRLRVTPKWRGLKAQWVKELTRENKTFVRVFDKADAGDVAGAVALLVSYDDHAARKLDHRFDAVGLTSCSQLRRQ